MHQLLHHRHKKEQIRMARTTGPQGGIGGGIGGNADYLVPSWAMTESPAPLPTTQPAPPGIVSGSGTPHTSSRSRGHHATRAHKPKSRRSHIIPRSPKRISLQVSRNNL